MTFSACAPPQLSGRILFAPPEARDIFLHNDMLCNVLCNWGCITYWRGGAQTKKNPKNNMHALREAQMEKIHIFNKEET